MYLLEVGENLAKKNKTKNSIILETYSWKARLKSNLKEKTARTNKAVFKKKKRVGGWTTAGRGEEQGTDVFLYKLFVTI